METIKKGDDQGKYRLEIHGLDYYNAKTGEIELNATEKIALTDLRDVLNFST